MGLLFWQNPIISLAIIAAVQVLLLAMKDYFTEGRAVRLRLKEKAEELRLRMAEKEADWKRQDEVAERVDEVARLASAADLRVQSQLKALDEQGKKIHILVNSDMTAARTAERDAMALLVIALKSQVAAILKIQGPAPKELTDQIEYAEGRIVELNQILADRLAAQGKVDAEAQEKKQKAGSA